MNYNVAYFLEQCLNSVMDAMNDLQGEVFVIDNNSIDGSVDMVKEKFPAVKLIANKNNVGFSKANNQAMEIAKGAYVLLLNPDTVVEQDTFQKCIDFMDGHPDGGGLGVRMIDGKGNFLPESKRGLPTPSVAFYKIFGLSKLFPKSKRFGQYHLGFLDEMETNEIEILSGAYMFMRKKALDKIGLLDEAFFMYGEDIDLSYRIRLGGYKNYYLPETKIIHYKGESTKKSSINYVFVFYRAMVIFAQKHFTQKNAKLFSFFINMAIYFRAGLAILSRFIKRIFLPVIDFILLSIGLYEITYFWAIENIDFPVKILIYAIPSYILVWLLSTFYLGGYDYPIKLKCYLSGTLVGTIFILIIYALLPKEFQFSRLFILSGALLVLTYFLLSRVFLHFLFHNRFDLGGIKNKKFAIIGEEEEVDRVRQILQNTTQKIQSIYAVSPTRENSDAYNGTIDQLDQIIDIYGIDEVIFCAKNTPAEEIMEWMSKINLNNIEFKIAQPNSMYLIGSNSIDSAGDLYLMEIDNISAASSKRNKRTLDLITTVLFLLLSPFLIWFYKQKNKFLKNCWQVLIGKRSWVGYSYGNRAVQNRLPQIRMGVLTPAEERYGSEDESLIAKLNLIYARDYSIFTDIHILWKYYKRLDR